MRNKTILFLVLLFLLCSSVLFAAPDPKFLTIGTASSGGAYYPIGIAMADIITNKLGIQTTAQITGGAIENNSLINKKVLDFAISQAVMAYNAYNGLPPYKEKLRNVRGMISSLSKGIFQLVVNKNSSIKSIKDLKGKKVALGPAGGGAITTFMEVFSTFGFTEKDFQPVYTSYEQSAEALVDGNLDAILVHAAAPTPALTQIIAAKKPVRFLSFDEESLNALLKKYSFYGKQIIPKEMYGTDEPVVTFFKANIVIVNKDLSTDLVYRMNKALFENIETIRKSQPSVKGFNLEEAAQGMPIPWHPGAEKFFKEKGLIK